MTVPAPGQRSCSTPSFGTSCSHSRQLLPPQLQIALLPPTFSLSPSLSSTSSLSFFSLFPFLFIPLAQAHLLQVPLPSSSSLSHKHIFCKCLPLRLFSTPSSSSKSPSPTAYAHPSKTFFFHWKSFVPSACRISSVDDREDKVSEKPDHSWLLLLMPVVAVARRRSYWKSFVPSTSQISSLDDQEDKVSEVRPPLHARALMPVAAVARRRSHWKSFVPSTSHVSSKTSTTGRPLRSSTCYISSLDDQEAKSDLYSKSTRPLDSKPACAHPSPLLRYLTE